jgi:hypothetical protein
MEPRPCDFCGEVYLPRSHRHTAFCTPRCRGRAQRLWIRYRLRPAAFRLFWDVQHGRCALPGCRVILDQFTCHVDHDHETDQVRGLLCRQCNWLEGAYKEAIRRGVVSYLEESDARSTPISSS